MEWGVWTTYNKRAYTTSSLSQSVSAVKSSDPMTEVVVQNVSIPRVMLHSGEGKIKYKKLGACICGCFEGMMSNVHAYADVSKVVHGGLGG